MSRYPDCSEIDVMIESLEMINVLFTIETRNINFIRHVLMYSQHNGVIQHIFHPQQKKY